MAAEAGDFTTLITQDVGVNEVHAHARMRARADIVATKLGIILLLFSFSFHLLFSQKGFAYDFDFLHAFLSNKKIRFSQK